MHTSPPLAKLKDLGSITSVSSGETLDSAELGLKISHSASILKNLGVGPGSHVVLCHGNSPDFFTDLFAVWQLGACASCLSPESTTLQVANVADLLSPSAVLVDEGFSAGQGLRAPVICCSREPASNSQLPAGANVFGGDMDGAALILFTSGTTGAPKGVEHSFRSLSARIALNRQYIGDEILANSLCVLPTHFGHGLIGNCLTPLFAGKNLILHQPIGITSAGRFGKLIDTHEITFMTSVPALWQLVLKVAKPPMGGSLRQVSVGSAPLAAKLWRDVISWTGTNNVVNMYGITELANWVAGASASEFSPEEGLIGRTWGGRAALLDEHGNLRDEGEGELLVESPSLMMGYHQRPDLTAETMWNGWYKTGDIGRINSGGVLSLVGRTRLEINRAGIKIHPEELESLLVSHPSISEACVFGLPDEISGEKVAAAVCLNAGVAIDTRALRQWCLTRLRREQIPERWFIVKEIPTTDRGKINRQAVIDSCMTMETG